MPWEERVARSAVEALADFEAIQSKFDFIAEGRRGFEKHFDDFEANGGDLSETMCFVWYVETEETLARRGIEFRGITEQD